jgi:hypothetical protein
MAIWFLPLERLWKPGTDTPLRSPFKQNLALRGAQFLHLTPPRSTPAFHLRLPLSWTASANICGDRCQMGFPWINSFSHHLPLDWT